MNGPRRAPSTRADSRSFWLDTADPPPHAPLDRDLSVDVVVLGAGVAGLCTAFELARAGREVILLEAGRTAGGTSGFTTGVLCTLQGLTYSRIVRTRGELSARRYAAAQQDALGRVVELCAELAIDCQLERLPAYSYAQREQLAQDLEAEAAAARRAGLDARLVAQTALPFPTAGAVRLAGQYQFHPVLFLQGLAKAFIGLGGRIYEQTRVTGLHEGARIRLGTAGGHAVHAREAVIATQFPLFGPATLTMRLRARRELVVAGPIPAHGDPKGVYGAVESSGCSLRTAPYRAGQRLLIVTGEAFPPGAGGVAERFDRLEDWAVRRFPDLADTGRLRRWATQDVDSGDRLPYVGHLHPGTQHVYVATGFGGWPLTNGVMAGRLLAAHIGGGPRPDWTELFDPRRVLPPREVPDVLRTQRAVAGHYLGDRRGLERVHSLAEVAQLPKGSGAVVRLDGQPCAVHRDEQEAVHVVSARCPHRGCLVGFNDAERTWECPCHGSRFDIDGSLLQGPATQPLERLEDGAGVPHDEPGRTPPEAGQDAA
ncbi:FAD-dependent oxidoreductase [Streptomyces sp. NPDC006879]|uniref:FAD-dependent oxidoreductase n=1 Tax=Streptomyces sp. NPDC006879 TaxID=3364767 RepID=UPI0036B7E6E4